MLGSIVFGGSRETEIRIYSLIINAIVPDKSDVVIWTDDKKRLKYLEKFTNIRFSDTPDKADLLIVKETEGIKSDRPIFAISYPILKYYKDSALGGFYWQKGRPNVIFLQENLRRKGITLPKSMSKFVETRL